MRLYLTGFYNNCLEQKAVFFSTKLDSCGSASFFTFIMMSSIILEYCSITQSDACFNIKAIHVNILCMYRKGEPDLYEYQSRCYISSDVISRYLEFSVSKICIFDNNSSSIVLMENLYYVCRFIPEYSTVVEPLRCLTMEECAWTWVEDQKQSLQ